MYWISNLGDRRSVLRSLTGVAMFTGTNEVAANTGTFEELEARRLLSASLLSGVLTVKGSVNDDSIVVSLKSGDANRLAVNINGVTTTFVVSAVSSIVV